MGKDVVHVGPLGSGATLKLVDNFFCAVQGVAFGEALAMIDKCGLDAEKSLPVLLNGAPGSPLVKNMAGRIAAHDASVHFYLGLMQKDLTYAIEEAQRHSLELRTASLARELFHAAAENGFASSDLSTITDYLRGLPPGSRAFS